MISGDTETRPTFIFLPGAFQTPAHFAPIVSALQHRGYEGKALMLAGRGETAETAEVLESVTTAQTKLKELVEEQGKDVVLVACSYAGLIASMALKGLERSLRQRRGLTGGVTHVVFIAALLVPEGMKLVDILPGKQLPPWASFDEKRGVLVPSPGAKDLFFSDMEERLRTHYASELVAQTPKDSVGVVKGSCWDLNVPKIYIHTSRDQTLPKEMQNKVLSLVRSVRPKDWSTFTIDSGHSPFLSRVEDTIELLENCCRETRQRARQRSRSSWMKRLCAKR